LTASGGRPRILFWGMLNDFSLPPLAALLAAGLEVAAVFIPASDLHNQPVGDSVSLLAPQRPPATLPLVNPYLNQNILHLAWEQGIPAYAIQKAGHPAVHQLIDQLQPDIACVACFTQRIPASILNRPPEGFLNIHPSRLPRFRGPAPLFWIFHEGAQHDTGVTVHIMDDDLDTGAIVSQTSLSLPDGISGPAAEQVCAELGGQLLVSAVEGLQRSTIRPQPQGSGGHYFPWPGPADFRLLVDWPARRAFNFMRGTADWREPYRLRLGGKEFLLGQALSYSAEGRLPSAVVSDDDSLLIQFASGHLQARLFDSSGTQ
jgi:methionyl-tRNA formyltransferase